MVKEKPENWEDKLYHHLDKPLIEPQLYKLKLNTRYSLDDVRAEGFMIVKQEFNKKKLECQVDSSELIIVKINPDGTREQIKNIKAWLRVVIYRYLIKCIKDEDS